MLKTKTILARIVWQAYPPKGYGAILLIDARGVDEEQLMIERGCASDDDIEALKKTFCFIKLVQGMQYYKIDKVITIDDFQLINELVSIPKNGFTK